MIEMPRATIVECVLVSKLQRRFVGFVSAAGVHK